MESRNDISIGKYNLHKATVAFKNKLSTELQDPLQTIFDQHKSGLKPLTGYYISAKKGKKELSKKIAMDVTIKFIEIFVANFMKQTISSPEITNAITNLNIDESLDRRSHSTNFYLPESISPFSEYGISLGIDSKGNPKIDLQIKGYEEEYFVKFVVNKQFQKDLIESKIIFKVVFTGGFFDMLIKNALSDNRSFTLGELGGELLIYVTKLPFIDFKIKQLLFDKYISIPLDDLIVSTPKLVINSG